MVAVEEWYIPLLDPNLVAGTLDEPQSTAGFERPPTL